MSRISFAVLSFLFAGAALAADPRIENLTAIASGSKVSIRFALADAFDSGDMVQSLQSGVPTSLTYEAEIYRDRPNWFDESVARSRIDVITTFNSVTREYLLNYRRDRKLVRSETFSDLTALQNAMTKIDERDLFDIGARRPYKLKVRVRADLMRSWRFYVIPWEITTRWRETRVQCPECKAGSARLSPSLIGTSDPGCIPGTATVAGDISHRFSAGRRIGIRGPLQRRPMGGPELPT